MSDPREQSPTAEAALLGQGDHDEHHVLPIGLYLKVYGSLVVLTYLTVQVSYMDLGGLSLPAAMTIAIVKAGLVVGFFMHLRYDTRFNSFVFFSSILFIVIFFGFTMLDLTSRGSVNPETATFAYEAEAQAVNDARAEEQAVQAERQETPAESPPAEAPPAEHSAPSGGH